ncbi:MAG TPA: ATP-binding protein [Solirubrobacteraceae bacterium]|nr:ATP-binding protein [Solirubrobacteraceae bacterium]
MMTPTSRSLPTTRRPAPLHLALRRSVEAPGIARTAAAEHCERFGLDGSTCQTLLLLVSELVSNAVLHSAAPPEAIITMTVAVGDEAISVTVTDAGDGFVPGQRDPARADGGYGLYLLERAASRWGVESRGATSVWFELPLSD